MEGAGFSTQVRRLLKITAIPITFVNNCFSNDFLDKKTAIPTTFDNNCFSNNFFWIENNCYTNDFCQ